MDRGRGPHGPGALAAERRHDRGVRARPRRERAASELVARRLSAAGSRSEIRFAPATIIAEAARVEFRLPNGIAVEVTNASPSWAAALIAELTRAS